MTYYRNYDDIEMYILKWAEDRGIIGNSTPEMQFLKGTSEWGELADAIAKRDTAAIQDAVGDVMVCMINMCAMLELDIVECMNIAYGQIKDRKGYMIPGGVFVKE